MKRFIIFLLVLCIFLQTSTNATVFAKDAPPAVSADSVVLIDAETGTILYSKNMNSAYPPASTTKIMTALLSIEKTNLNEIVTVSKKTPYVDGSKIGIFEGEQISVKDLLYGLLLLSGNDCAEALAEHIGGSIENFSKLMTERAKELGCENTNFVNPHGLYDDNHRTSAKDLALILREAMKHPEFREIASTFSYKIPPTNKHPEGIHLANENKLINKNSKYYYPNAEAGKTGYTVQSRFSYVASASKNGQRLIAAFVHSTNKTYYDDSKKLFEYGFNNFELVPLYKKGDLVTTYSRGGLSVPLMAADDYFYVKEKGSSDQPQCKVAETDLTTKDFKKGDNIAETAVTLKDKTLPNLELLSGADHEVKTAVETTAPVKVSEKLNIDMKNNWIYGAGAAAIALIGIATILIRKFKKKKRRKLKII